VFPMKQDQASKKHWIPQDAATTRLCNLLSETGRKEPLEAKPDFRVVKG